MQSKLGQIILMFFIIIFSNAVADFATDGAFTSFQNNPLRYLAITAVLAIPAGLLVYYLNKSALKLKEEE